MAKKKVELGDDCPDCGGKDSLSVIMAGPLTDYVECTDCGTTWSPDQYTLKS